MGAEYPNEFNHIRELHHSQTQSICRASLLSFNHIRELHHSQTDNNGVVKDKEFNHIRELHHSQTWRWSTLFS